MKLQIAVDVADTGSIMEMAEKIHDVVDIFEVGTPVIMKEGIRPVKKLKEKYPGLTVLADSKIVDGGALECTDLCENGADIVTVLALADDATIREVVETAHTYGRLVMADLICVKNPEKRGQELLDMNVDILGIHVGVDMQKEGKTPLGELRALKHQFPGARISVAGGINRHTISSYVEEGPEILIVGKALYGQEDIRAAAEEMKGEIER